MGDLSYFPPFPSGEDYVDTDLAKFYSKRMPAISITALDDPVAIVHIPIQLAEHTAAKLYWTIIDAADVSGEFFNVTSNRIEIAVFARTNLINSHWTDVGDGEIKISSTWRVFEISSGDEGETSNYDSPHLRHVSAPLSRAGISILYQSSYFTDFLLVKESDFPIASNIFAQQGWHIDPSVPPHRRRSQLVSPITPLISNPSNTQPVSAHPAIPEVTVLASPLACVGFSRTNEQTVSERVRQLVCWPEQARLSWRLKRMSNHECVSDSDLPHGNNDRSPDDDGGRPFVSFTRTEDGVSVLTETRILRCMFGKQLEGGDEDEEEERGEYQLSGRLAMGYVTDTTELDDSEASDDEVDLEEDDDDDVHSEGRGGTSDARGEGLVCNGTTPLAKDQDDTYHTLGFHTPPQSAAHHRGRRPMSLPATPRDGPGSETIPISWHKSSGPRRSTSSFKVAVAVTGDGIEGDEGRRKRPGRKRCLQLDLRGIGDEDSVYHLDKSGLVTRFSDLLDSSCIKMLYSSTFHTANILVEAGDVMRAKRLLEARGNEGRKQEPGEGYF